MKTAVACAALVLLGCGGAQKEAEAPEAETQTTSQRVRPQGSGMQVQTELGVINQVAAQKTFFRLQAPLNTCYKNALKRVEYLEGEVKVFLRVGQDGTIRYGYLEGSTLGDRDAEKCMMDTLTATSWPKPEGGEAEVRNAFAFDGPGNVRPPVEWDAGRMSEALSKASDAIQACRGDAHGRFHATAYIEPDGKQGKVQTVGITPPGKDGIEKIDCLVDAVKALKPPSPGSYAAKVSFEL